MRDNIALTQSLVPGLPGVPSHSLSAGAAPVDGGGLGGLAAGAGAYSRSRAAWRACPQVPAILRSAGLRHRRCRVFCRVMRRGGLSERYTRYKGPAGPLLLRPVECGFTRGEGWSMAMSEVPERATKEGEPGLDGASDELARSLGSVWKRFSGQRPKSASVEIEQDIVRC